MAGHRPHGREHSRIGDLPGADLLLNHPLAIGGSVVWRRLGRRRGTRCGPPEGKHEQYSRPLPADPRRSPTTPCLLGRLLSLWVMFWAFIAAGFGLMFLAHTAPFPFLLDALITSRSL